MPLSTLSKPNWYLDNRGFNLHIDDRSEWFKGKMCAVDVETDEQDNFVGAGIYPGGEDVYYYSDMLVFKEVVQDLSSFGHNFKFDMHQIAQWGITVSLPTDDTMIMSYVLDPVRPSHSLKALEATLLGNVRPTYKDIVGVGKKKKTLDKQDVELVANYCGSDCVATWKLYSIFSKLLKKQSALNTVYQREMRVMNLLFNMECAGVQVDVKYLRQLDHSFKMEIGKLSEILRRNMVLSRDRLLGKARIVAERVRNKNAGKPNPNSPEQIKYLLLQANGITAASTDRRILQDYADYPLVRTLLRYREVAKLRSTYTQGLLAQKSLPRVHSTFNQISYRKSGDTWSGIRTGRLSSNSPNLHNIPIRTKTGDLLRRAFVAKKGHILVDADYSQIEYRLLAHFSEEPRLIEAYNKGADVHEETGKLLGVDRALGKTLNFAAIYGAQAWRISKTANIPESDAYEFLKKYWKALPKVSEFISFTKAKARQDKGVYTLGGWFIPLPDIASDDIKLRFRAERQAVNYLIQGSAAEIIKLAMISCSDHGLSPILQVHDELLFEIEEDACAELAMANIKRIMQCVVELKVPLEVSAKIGYDWKEAH